MMVAHLDGGKASSIDLATQVWPKAVQRPFMSPLPAVPMRSQASASGVSGHRQGQCHPMPPIQTVYEQRSIRARQTPPVDIMLFPPELPNATSS